MYLFFLNGQEVALFLTKVQLINVDGMRKTENHD